MANIDYSTIQIIVENAMRTSGYGGTKSVNGQTIDLENAWKDNDFGISYQTLRDVISKSIVDALNATDVSGNISQGTVSAAGQQTVVAGSSVKINNPTDTQAAARVDDSVTSDAAIDPNFWAWVTAVSTALSIPHPVSSMGKITSGSSTVKIGG